MFPEREGGCGYPESSTGSGELDSYRLYDGCLLRVPVEVPASGDYAIEVETWILDEVGRDPEITATLGLSVPYLYRDGDTWYRHMRRPGFVREPGFVTGEVPEDYNENSLQWLAERIVEDDRFAEAAVKFWWPAIMGSEVVALPEESDDADYEARKLEADVQDKEVRRLADRFRRGFEWSGEGAYNLKDLLVELAMSPWFRAATTDAVDRGRDEAHRNAGAKRLLTPEELARKTLAFTGFQWGRHHPHGPPHQHGWSELTDTKDRYGLLYGGIDSRGVIERARTMTSVMAGVAQSHALESSCPIVLRELYLLPQGERRLFAGIEARTTPAFEFGDDFEIAASSRSDMEEMGAATVEGSLRAGSVSVALAFLNRNEGGRIPLLDRLVVRRGTMIVHEYEMENHEHPHDCHHVEQEAFHLSGSDPGCVLTVPFDIPENGDYAIDLWAWADPSSGDDPAQMEVLVESDTESSPGAHAIRSKLVDLYDKLLGVDIAADSPRLLEAYDRFVEIWKDKNELGGHFLRNDVHTCEWGSDGYYFDGIADLYDDEQQKWVGVDEYFADIYLSDARGAAQAWTVMLAYLLMDYRYLHL